MKRQFGFSIEEAEMCPGTVGAVLFDDQPRLTAAHVRPFVWAILLYRGAVHSWEVVNALSAVCSIEDMKEMDEDEDERTWAEACTDEVLAEMLIEGLLDYNEAKDIWVLRYSNAAVPQVIKAVAGVDGQMPKHFVVEMAGSN